QGCQRWQATSRMPGYKRVDLGLYKDFAIGSDGTCKRPSLRSAKLGVEVFNLFDFANTISYFWVSDNDGHRFGVPNYLTSRRINVKLNIEF
ncbi:MAG: TonB-dependent receptor, partial [Bacteroidales bacterium]|nr:TonB-dependent receptor [Bacteroidales bacterium]